MSGLPPGATVGLLATATHTVGYLVVLVLMAALVYERLGLRLLRTAWINLDLVWAGALACTARADGARLNRAERWLVQHVRRSRSDNTMAPAPPGAGP